MKQLKDILLIFKNFNLKNMSKLGGNDLIDKLRYNVYF